MFRKRTISVLGAALVCACGLASAQGAVPAMNTAVSQGERAAATYFTEDSVGDVQLGELGLKKSKNSAVRQLAQALVHDHTITANDGMRVARTIGDMGVKWKPGAGNQMDLTRLSRYSGAQFDREYVKTLVQAHQADIDTAKNALEFATNAGLKRYLRETLGVDEKHLKMAQADESKI